MRRDCFFHVTTLWIQLRKIISNRSLHRWDSTIVLLILVVCVLHALFGSFVIINHAFDASFSLWMHMVCMAKLSKNVRVFNRIVAEGIEMTIIRFDFQDLFKIVGLHQPENYHEYSSWCRCCWYRSQQSFPERSPVIPVVASTFLAHLSNDSGCRFLLRFTNNAVLYRPAWLEERDGCTSCAH